MQKMRIDFESGTWHGVASEGVWVEKIGGDLFKIKSTPFYAIGLSFLDDVIAKFDELTGDLLFKEVASHSGHSTYRIIVTDSEIKLWEIALWKKLEVVGCSFEEGITKLYAIDVPPITNIQHVYSVLQRGESEGVWEFEEGHCGHPV